MNPVQPHKELGLRSGYMDITLHITKFPFSSEQSPKKEKFDKIIGSSTPDNSRTCQLKRQQLVHLRPIYPHQSSLKSFHSGFLVPMFEQVGWRRVWRKGCPGHHAPAARCHHSYHAPARSSSSSLSFSSSSTSAVRGIIFIITTRPKPAYGRQGLVGVWLRASGAHLGRGK